MPERVSRRRFLAVSAGSAAVPFTGCSRVPSFDSPAPRLSRLLVRNHDEKPHRLSVVVRPNGDEGSVVYWDRHSLAANSHVTVEASWAEADRYWVATRVDDGPEAATVLPPSDAAAGEVCWTAAPTATGDGGVRVASLVEDTSCVAST